MENTRSYLSRFSGLLLFLLTLLVVGVLVVLTIRAASDDDTADTSDAVAVESETPEFTIENGTTVTQPDADESEGVVATNDEDLSVDVQVPPVDVPEVAGAVDTTTGDGEDDVDPEVLVATGGTLPNTGAEASVILTIAVIAFAGAYVSSRRDLAASLLKK